MAAAHHGAGSVRLGARGHGGRHHLGGMDAAPEQTHGGVADPAPPTKRNLVFMVSDGMGPASLAMTRGFRQFMDGAATLLARLFLLLPPPPPPPPPPPSPPSRFLPTPTMGRSNSICYGWTDTLDEPHASTSSLVTDSAAGATAFSCGRKDVQRRRGRAAGL